MAVEEKVPSVEEGAQSRTVPASQIETPPGWKYKKYTLVGKTLWYASPPVQLFIVAMVCFLCPGMFNAVNGIGGAGLGVKYVADNSNTILYSCFAALGFFSGTITNRLGVKVSLVLGGIGYSVYLASFLCFKHTENTGFAYFAGALLGVCAGLLWSAQGAIMMSYPNESSKGRYISWFWMIFNLGAVIGGLIPLGQNIADTSTGSVSDGTYIGFIVLTLLGALTAWLLVSADTVIRSDGSRVILMKHPSWKSELLGLVETFKLEPWIVFLFPMFFASNWFYTYQFNTVNASKFDVRTRALNSVLYWLAQIAGAFIFGYGLDLKYRRRSKALAAWAVLFVLTMAIWGGGYAWQKGYTRAEVNALPEPTTEIYDWTTSGYVGPMFLYIFYGFFDAAWQTTVYWFMGAMTNNGRRLANYAGFYKGIQSAGAAVAFNIDANQVNFLAQFASCWGLLSGSLVLALPLLIIKVTDHTPIDEDLKFSDESFSDVAPQGERSAARGEMIGADFGGSRGVERHADVDGRSEEVPPPTYSGEK